MEKFLWLLFYGATIPILGAVFFHEKKVSGLVEKGAGFISEKLSFRKSIDSIYANFITKGLLLGLTMIFFAIYTAWTNVAMPRMSALHAHNNLTEFRKIIYKSSSLLFSFSIPIVILCCIFTPDIINIIAGKGYEGAVIPLRVQIPLIFIIGYSQILVIQILIPLKKDNALTVIAGVGA